MSDEIHTYGAPARFQLKLGEIDLKLESIPGVGKTTANKLREKGIEDLSELFLTFPRKYRKIYEYAPGYVLAEEQPEFVRCIGVIERVKAPAPRSRQPFEIYLQTRGITLKLLWFNLKGDWFAKKFSPGMWLDIEGAIEFEKGQGKMFHPNVEVVAENIPYETHIRVEPVYTVYDGIKESVIPKAIRASWPALQAVIVESLPEKIIRDLELISVAEALENVHVLKPTTWDALQPALDKSRERLVFEEFFGLQLTMAQQYVESRRAASAPILERRARAEEFLKSTGFDYTSDQTSAFEILRRELASRVPMRRMVQGDVGSGKTVVALFAAVIAAENGAQTAFMAPTDVLATQHYNRSKAWLDALGVESALLTGSTGTSERSALLRRLAAGEIDVLFGTHALFSKDVVYAGNQAAEPAPQAGLFELIPGSREPAKGLGLVIVDEQHKFGVEQRAELMAKGKDPHLLAMTATPIPRSLAHAYFGDLDLIIIREKPPGRVPIKTVMRTRDTAEKLFEYLRERIEEHGEQAYFVYPLVEASEGLAGRMNVVEGAEYLANGPLSGIPIGVLHGRMAAAEKDAVMQRFANGQLKVLCSTTVIEVGVDVGAATLMIIESPDLFGLSQLHQLRGRVGRSSARSFCVLMLDPSRTSEDAHERLQAFVENEDGFKLSEIDLIQRGPGLLLGARQAGVAEFRFGDLVRDAALLDQARAAARRLILGDARV